VLYGIEDVPPLLIGFFRLALAVPLLAARRAIRGSNV
jgi:drug/metabolite transporter, DME family